MITLLIVLASVAVYLFIGYRFIVWDVKHGNAWTVKQYIVLYFAIWPFLWPIAWIQDASRSGGPFDNFVDRIEDKVNKSKDDMR